LLLSATGRLALSSAAIILKLTLKPGASDPGKPDPEGGKHGFHPATMADSRCAERGDLDSGNHSGDYHCEQQRWAFAHAYPLANVPVNSGAAHGDNVHARKSVGQPDAYTCAYRATVPYRHLWAYADAGAFDPCAAREHAL